LSKKWNVAKLMSVISSSLSAISCGGAIPRKGLSTLGPLVTAAEALPANNMDATPTIPASGAAAFRLFCCEARIPLFITLLLV
jgi:hypothetical protein